MAESANTQLPRERPALADSNGTSDTARETLGEALRRAREAAGLSLRNFAAAVAAHPLAAGHPINHVALWRLERGYSIRTPSSAVLAACDAVAGTGDLLQTKGASSAPDATAASQIPAASDGFVGRRLVWSTLDAFLKQPPGSRCRILSLTGLPGVGKTAVVAQWYHATAERNAGQFPQVCWVNLRGYSRNVGPLHPDAALESLLHQVNPTRAIPSRGEKRAELFYSLCNRTPVLLILDNAATAEQVLPLIPPSPHCRVVVTSRTYLERLVTEHGAKSLTLPPLAETESQQLLRHWFGDRISAEPAATARVAALCGHLPMALTLAGEYLQRHPHLTAHDLAERLEQDGNRLDLLTADTRHIRGTFLLSYQVLPEQTQQVFRLLGLHPSPEVTVESAAALTGLTVTDIQAHLDALVDARLLEQIDLDRYRFHDLLREFAAEQAQHSDTDSRRSAALDRILHYYLSTAAAAATTVNPKARLPVTVSQAPRPFSTHYDATQWLTVERSNLHAAAQLALHRGDPALCWHLAVVQGWEVTGAKTMWHNAHLLGLRAARDSSDTRGAAWCMHHLGLWHRQLREWREAETYLTQALVKWLLLGDQVGQAWTLWAQAQLLGDQGEHADALHLYQSLLHQGPDDGYFRSVVQASMGAVYCTLPVPNPEAAVNTLREALEYFVSEDIRTAEAQTLTWLAEAWQHLGNRQKALRLLNRAYSTYAGVGATTGLADVLLRQAHIQMTAGDLFRARSAAVSARAMFASAGDPRTRDADDILAAITQTVFS